MQVLLPKINRLLLCFKFGLRLVWQSAPNWTTVNVAILVIQGTLPLLSLYLMKGIVDTVAAGLANPGKGQSFKQVVLLICCASMVAILTNLCNSIAVIVNQAQAQLVTDRVQDTLHAKAVELDLEHYENSQYYDILYRAQQQASSQPIIILNRLVQFGQSSLSLLGISGLLFSLHGSIALLLFMASVPGVFARLVYANQMYRWKTKRTILERQAWYFHWMLTGNIHIKEILLFNLGSVFRSRFRNLRKQLCQESLEITSRRSITDLAAQASATVIMYGSYGFMAYQTVQGTITLGDLVIYQQAFQRGQGYLQEMLSSLAGLYEDSLFLSNLYDFLNLKPKVVESLYPQTVPQPIQIGIKLNHVCFHYPDSKQRVLEDITLAIRPKELIALVGENGAGKSTLIKLLCRLYDPTEGSITLDGIDMRQFAIADLRGQISIILQDYGRYNLSAQDNIWFGNIELPHEHEKIVVAARDAGIDQLISQFRCGYRTILGKWIEGGEELSIGQWQKVALARAFLRDAQIIILDEPTSSLDAKAEAEIFARFRQLVKGRTAILISHRLSTVKMADCIYVLENGRIVESGTHDQLVRLDGTYARLFETQAQYYR